MHSLTRFFVAWYTRYKTMAAMDINCRAVTLKGSTRNETISPRTVDPNPINSVTRPMRLSATKVQSIMEVKS